MTKQTVKPTATIVGSAASLRMLAKLEVVRNTGLSTLNTATSRIVAMGRPTGPAHCHNTLWRGCVTSLDRWSATFHHPSRGSCRRCCGLSSSGSKRVPILGASPTHAEDSSKTHTTPLARIGPLPALNEDRSIRTVIEHPSVHKFPIHHDLLDAINGVLVDHRGRYGVLVLYEARLNPSREDV